MKLGDKMVDNEEYTVVIVDDEEMVTTAIGTLFMLVNPEYNVLDFNSPSEALEKLKTQEVDLVISDYLMPGEMNGVQFLTKLKELQPDAIRILLTAYADKENAIKGINEVGLHQYVEKPWDNDNLLLLVRNGLLLRKSFKQLKAKMKELDIATEKLQQVQTEILKAFV